MARPGQALLTVVLGAIPALVAAGRGDAVGPPAAVALFLAAGAAGGWAVDDPAAELFAPLPIGSPVRLAVRILTVAGVVAGTAAVLLILMAFGPGLPADLGGRGTEAAAAGALALAVGLVAVRRGERAVSPLAVTAGALGIVVIGGLAFRWPSVFPSLGASPVHGRWWFVAAGALLVAVRSGRDPSRP
ncbi:MAG TPA: hypothetical protein VFV35_06615 [Acidimicrobiales bacterium]|nr:hypothetical protein [Acidimicrobiales bacterium]